MLLLGCETQNPTVWMEENSIETPTLSTKIMLGFLLCVPQTRRRVGSMSFPHCCGMGVLLECISFDLFGFHFPSVVRDTDTPLCLD